MLKYYVLSNAICQEVCKGSRTSPGKPLLDLSQILPPGEKCASYNKGALIGLVTRYLFCISQAEACKSFSQALKKCPKGMYAEIKYDGERVQVICFAFNTLTPRSDKE